MARKDKGRCEHGNSPIYVQGCPSCAMTAMQGLKLCRDNGWTFKELWGLLHHAFKTPEDLAAALKQVREDIAKHGAGD